MASDFGIWYMVLQDELCMLHVDLYADYYFDYALTGQTGYIFHVELH